MNTYQNSFDGNIPQDVTARPGENAIFIVYSLKHSADTFVYHINGNKTKKQHPRICLNIIQADFKIYFEEVFMFL